MEQEQGGCERSEQETTDAARPIGDLVPYLADMALEHQGANDSFRAWLTALGAAVLMSRGERYFVPGTAYAAGLEHLPTARERNRRLCQMSEMADQEERHAW